MPSGRGWWNSHATLLVLQHGRALFFIVSLDARASSDLYSSLNSLQSCHRVGPAAWLRTLFPSVPWCSCFIGPLFSLELTLEAFLSINTQGFLLKVSQKYIISTIRFEGSWFNPFTSRFENNEKEGSTRGSNEVKKRYNIIFFHTQIGVFLNHGQAKRNNRFMETKIPEWNHTTLDLNVRHWVCRPTFYWIEARGISYHNR